MQVISCKLTLSADFRKRRFICGAVPLSYTCGRTFWFMFVFLYLTCCGLSFLFRFYKRFKGERILLARTILVRHLCTILISLHIIALYRSLVVTVLCGVGRVEQFLTLQDQDIVFNSPFQWYSATWICILQNVGVFLIIDRLFKDNLSQCKITTPLCIPRDNFGGNVGAGRSGPALVYTFVPASSLGWPTRFVWQP